VPPSPATAGPAGGSRPALRALPRPPLRVVDVAVFYGERSGGIRTYLDAKAAYAARSGAFEHHLVVPGRRERHLPDRHELRSLPAAGAKGYRIPLGTAALKGTLRRLAPDIVLLHDPFWAGPGVAETARRAGAVVVAVHHSSVTLASEGLPGQASWWRPLLRPRFRATYGAADEVMSVVDTRPDSGRAPSLALRLGVDSAFRPRPDVRRGDHVLCVGRISREKRVSELLEAAALSEEPWPLVLAGSGPAESAVRRQVKRLGLTERVSVRPHVTDRDGLARAYSAARCAVMPGPFETFGLIALEAAATGTPVAACVTAPATRAAAGLAHPFLPGDPAEMLRAIESARRAGDDPRAGAELAERHSWERALSQELAAVEDLVRGDRAPAGRPAVTSRELGRA